MLSMVDPTGRRTAACALRNCAYLLPLGALATWLGVSSPYFAYESGEGTRWLYDCCMFTPAAATAPCCLHVCSLPLPPPPPPSTLLSLHCISPNPAAFITGGMLLTAAKFYATPSLPNARLLFRASLLHLPLFLAAFLAHRIPNTGEDKLQLLVRGAVVGPRGAWGPERAAAGQAQQDGHGACHMASPLTRPSAHPPILPQAHNASLLGLGERVRRSEDAEPNVLGSLARIKLSFPPLPFLPSLPLEISAQLSCPSKASCEQRSDERQPEEGEEEAEGEEGAPSPPATKQ